MKKVKVSIVIPAYNEEKVIRRCVESCVNQSVPPLEILVIDNKSKDSTKEIVQSLIKEYPDAGIKYLQQFDKQGLIPTRNFGLDQAKGDVIGRIDADTRLTKDWVKVLTETFSDPEVAAATGPVAYYDLPGGTSKPAMKADDITRRLMLKLGRQYHFVFGSNMALRKTAWETIRSETCLDEEDLFHEDIDISIHLAQHGLKVAYNPLMRAGMSARRLEDKPKDFMNYVKRFSRTYNAHGIKNLGVRAPMVVFSAIYLPARTALIVSQKREARRAEANNIS